MKYLILLLNVLSFLLMADVAHAELISAAITAIGSFLGSISIGKLVLTVAINIGLSLIEKAMAKKDQQPAGTKLEISMGDDHAMSFIVGSYATAGKRKYAGTWGDDGKTPNAYFTDVIEIGSLPNRAGERGLTSVWIDDQKVGVLWDQPHPDGRGFPVLQYRVKNKDYLWIKFLDGTQTGPDPFLMAKFGSHAERPWKSTMIGRGCQVVILTSRYNTDLFKGVPAGLFEPHPLPLYDVRKDSSVGGNGGHRWTDSSTWQPSTNPAVIVYNLARGVYYGPEWVYGGQNIGAFCLPAANWMAAANACDASVPLDGGESESAFRAGYDVQCDQEPLDAISELLKGCNGRIAEVGGVFKMLVGTPGAAVYSFTDDDIVVTEEQDFQPFPALSATYNAIEATYPEPAEKWATKDAPGRYNADLEVQDGNRRLPAQVQLLAVPFANQVQRVGLAMIQDYRRFRVHQVSLPPDAYPLEPNDVVSWSSARNGYDEKKFLVVKVEPQPNFLIVVTLKEVDPADYDWHPGLQLPTAIGWLGPITPPSQPMIGWTVEPSTIKDAGGIDRRPAIKISCAPDLDDVAGVWVQVRLKETGDVVFDSDANPYASPFSWIISGQWTLPNTNYEARGRYLPQSNRATDWSAWLTVKTPNVLIQAADVLDGAIIQSKIADAAVTAAKIMDEAITSLKLADQAVSAAKLQVSAVTADVLASGAVIASKLADGAVTARALAQGAVDATSLASGLKAVEVVNALPTTGNVEGRQVYLTTDGKLYRYHNGAWTAAVAADDINGALNSAQIADSAITSNKLAALAVDASKLADGSVSAAKLAANAVDATKFANNIRPVEIVSSLPNTGNVEGRTVYLTTDDKLYRYTGSAWTAATPASDITGQMTDAQISALAAAKVTGTLVSSQIADGAITNQKLAALAVDAAKLADNAITTTKIADNAISTPKLQANVITADKIAANAVTTSALAVGAGKNLLQNAGFTMGLDCWTIGYISGTIPGLSLEIRPKGFPWAGVNNPTLMLFQNSGPSGFFTDVRWKRPDGDGLPWSLPFSMPCASGEWLEATAYISAHRCKVELRIEWVRADGTVSAYTAAAVNDSVQGSGTNPDLWSRLRIVGAAPADAVAASFHLRKLDTAAGETTSYMFLNQPMLCRIPAGATEPTPWRDGGIVLITTGGIVANAITAEKVAANAITADKIAANSVIAGKIAANAVTATAIAAGSVSADKIAANSITAGQIAAGAIGATQIAANAITADKLVIADMTNRVENPNFAFGSTSWALLAGLSVITDASNAYIGNNYLNVAAPATFAFNRNANMFPVIPGEQYFLQTFAKRTGAPSDSVSCRIRFMGADKITFLTALGITVLPTSSTTYAEYSNTVVVPAGAVWAWVDFVPTSTLTGTGSYQFGFVSCQRKSGGNLIVDGAITAAKVAANAITADKIAASNITAKHLVLTDMSNMVDQGWSGGSLDGWGTYGRQNFYYDAGNGGDSAGWVYQTNERDGALSKTFNVTPGETYYFETWVYNTNPDPMLAGALLVGVKADGSGAVFPMALTSTKNAWVRVAAQYTVHPGIVKLWMVMFTDKVGGSGGASTYFSKPVLRRASGAELIVDGAVTADKIAANSVTAGKLAANAVTAGTIAANAVTAGTIAAGAVTAAQIAAGAITTDKLAVGTGGNYLSNSDLSAGLTGWVPEYSNDGASFRFSLRTDSYAPQPGAIEIYQSNGKSGIEYGIWPVDASGVSRLFAVRANGWYELSVYYLGHRCVGVQPYLQFLDGNDNHITYYQWGIFPAYQNIDPQRNLANYQRFWGKVQMPANAAKVRVFFRMKGTVAGQGDSYLWLARMYFGEASQNQTEPTPWSDGSVTVVSAGNIVTGAVTADKIAANAVTAGKIAANAVTAGTIAAGAVTASTIAGGSISGDKIAANTIGANQIAAGAITAKSLVLTDFSNMVDNGWQGGNLDGWSIQNLQNFYLDSSAGDQAGYVVQSLGRDCCWSKSIAVTPGETYAFDVWVYNTDPNVANLYAAIYSGAGVLNIGGVTSTTVKNGWVRLQGRYTIPSGYVKLAMLLQVDKTAGTGSSCYWSKPIMRRAVSAELIVDGAITANKIAVNSLDAITANLGSVNISSAVIGTLQVGTSNIQAGACTDTGVGRVAGTQTLGGGNGPTNMVSCGVTVAGDGRVVVDCMAIAQINKSGNGPQGSQAVGLNIIRDGLGIFSQVYYLPVVRTVVSGGGNGGTSSETYTAGWVGVSGFYDAPGAGWHVYTVQLNNPGSTIGWNECNISASSYKR